MGAHSWTEGVAESLAVVNEGSLWETPESETPVKKTKPLQVMAAMLNGTHCSVARTEDSIVRSSRLSCRPNYERANTREWLRQ